MGLCPCSGRCPPPVLWGGTPSQLPAKQPPPLPWASGWGCCWQSPGDLGHPGSPSGWFQAGAPTSREGLSLPVICGARVSQTFFPLLLLSLPEQMGFTLLWALRSVMTKTKRIQLSLSSLHLLWGVGWLLVSSHMHPSGTFSTLCGSRSQHQPWCSC